MFFKLNTIFLCLEQILVHRILRDLQSFGDFTNRESLVPELDGPVLSADPMLDAPVHTLMTIQPSNITTEFRILAHTAGSCHLSDLDNRESELVSDILRLGERIERHNRCKYMHSHKRIIIRVS